ncbi:MAG: hypothetical protein AABY28_04670 [Candidatus Omnitrophota bacterium]
MEKNEFLKKEGDFKPRQSGIPDKAPGLSGKAFGIVKFILGVCLLPFVYSSSSAFWNEFGLIDKELQSNFWSGVISLLVIYLFVWEPAIIYNKGHKLLEVIFNFFKPLVKVAPYLLPIYTIVLFILYAILAGIIKDAWLIKYSIFLAGFTLALHLVFSAKAIRYKKGDFLKGNYIFGFSFIYVLNIALFSFCLNLIFKEFSFVNFSNSTYSLAKDIFSAVFKQLFLR